MGFEVVVEAVREEAKKWQGMADDMTPVSVAVEELELGALAFLVLSPSLLPNLDSIALAQSYNQMRMGTARQLRGAAVEFDEVAGALIKCADEYDRQDKICDLDFTKIYGK